MKTFILYDLGVCDVPDILNTDRYPQVDYIGYGETVHYSCLPGYSLIAGHLDNMCIDKDEDTWVLDGIPPVCLGRFSKMFAHFISLNLTTTYIFLCKLTECMQWYGI